MTGMYRGLTKEGNEVFGWLVVIRNRYYISYTDAVMHNHWQIRTFIPSITEFAEVTFESLAQFTGKHDKNKKPIYGSFEIDGVMTEGGDVVKGVNMHTMKVMWGIRRLGWCVQFTDRNTQYLEPMDDELFRDYECEVIIEGGE